MSTGEQVQKLLSRGVIHGQNPVIVNVMTNAGGIASGVFNTYIMTTDPEGINLFDISNNDQYNKNGDLILKFSDIMRCDVKTANMGITKFFEIIMKNGKWLPLIFNIRARDYDAQKNNIANMIDLITKYPYQK
jgi:hypothetical protein